MPSISQRELHTLHWNSCVIEVFEISIIEKCQGRNWYGIFWNFYHISSKLFILLRCSKYGFHPFDMGNFAKHLKIMSFWPSKHCWTLWKVRFSTSLLIQPEANMAPSMKTTKYMMKKLETVTSPFIFSLCHTPTGFAVVEKRLSDWSEMQHMSHNSCSIIFVSLIFSGHPIRSSKEIEESRTILKFASHF